MTITPTARPTLRRLAALPALLIAASALVVATSATPAQADNYYYPCDGWVLQQHTDGSIEMLYYDDQGGYGSMGTLGSINTDLLCT